MMPEYIGQQIGNYHLTRLLGQGGFATVYLGEHLYLKTQAAVKLLQVRIDSQDLQSFLKEAQIIAKLDHPHIIRVLDFGIDSPSSQPFFVMEYASRGSLRRVHPRGSILPLQTVVSYVQQVASALQYAHTQKIVHCDVKPENMLVASSHKIVLSDFGIAVTAHTTESVSKQNFTGTALYMAPEQIRGKALALEDAQRSTQPRIKRTNFVSYTTHPLPSSPPETSIPTEPSERTAIDPFLLAKIDPAPSKSPRPDRSYGPLSPNPEMITTQSPEKNLKSLPVRSAPLVSRRALVAGAITLATLSVGGFAWSRIASPPMQSDPTPGTTFLVYRGHASGVWTIGWSPDGKHIASGSDDQTIQIWDSTTGKKFFTYEGHVPLPNSKTINHPGSFVETLAWSPNGQWIASGGKEASLQVWNATTGNKLYTYLHKDLVGAVAWSKDGMWLASGGWEGTIHICEAMTGKRRIILTGHTSNLSSIDWSRDGSILISGNVDRTVRVWDTASGKTLYVYRGHSDAVKRSAFSPDGKKIASGGDDKQIHIWDYVNRSTLLIYDKHTGPVKSLAWSPDGKLIASAGDDHTVQIWNTSNGDTLFTYRGHLQTVSVKSAIWSLNGKRIASASYDQTVHIWESHLSSDTI